MLLFCVLITIVIGLIDSPVHPAKANHEQRQLSTSSKGSKFATWIVSPAYLKSAWQESPHYWSSPVELIAPGKENAHVSLNSHTGKEHPVWGGRGWRRADCMYTARQWEENLLWLILLFNNIQQIHTDCFPWTDHDTQKSPALYRDMHAFHAPTRARATRQ